MSINLVHYATGESPQKELRPQLLAVSPHLDSTAVLELPVVFKRQEFGFARSK
jgi:hypothetical protein